MALTERVAKAIFEVEEGNQFAFLEGDARQDVMKAARAAIAAIRDPEAIRDASIPSEVIVSSGGEQFAVSVAAIPDDALFDLARAAQERELVSLRTSADAENEEGHDDLVDRLAEAQSILMAGGRRAGAEDAFIRALAPRELRDDLMAAWSAIKEGRHSDAVCCLDKVR